LTQTPLDRAQFSGTQEYTYLNHAAVGVLPSRTRSALQTFIDAHAGSGVMGAWPYEARLPEYRAAVAAFINAKPAEIALLRNTGDGANVLAHGIDWQEGDEIVTADNEFPANVYPWLQCRRYGVNVRFVRTERERMTPDVLARTMTSRTRLVSVSWVSFADGYRHDLTALAQVAHRGGALLCVDVIQGLGALPIDVQAMGVDAAYGGGAKWLMALQGVSFLYVREPLLDRLRLAWPGWRSAADMWDFLDYDQPATAAASRFEGGTPNIIGALSLAESIAELKRPNVEAHVLALTDQLAEGLHSIGARILSRRGAGVSSAILLFTLPGCDSIAVGRALQEEQIVTTYRSNGVRVAPHGYNTPEEIGRLLEVTARARTFLKSA